MQTDRWNRDRCCPVVYGLPMRHVHPDAGGSTRLWPLRVTKGGCREDWSDSYCGPLPCVHLLQQKQGQTQRMATGAQDVGMVKIMPTDDEPAIPRLALGRLSLGAYSPGLTDTEK